MTNQELKETLLRLINTMQEHAIGMECYAKELDGQIADYALHRLYSELCDIADMVQRMKRIVSQAKSVHEKEDDNDE